MRGILCQALLIFAPVYLIAEESHLHAIQYFQNLEVQGQDVTSQILEAAKNIENLVAPDTLQNLNFLLIPGMFSDWASTKNRTGFDKIFNLKPQFYEQIRTLEDWKLSYEILDVESEARPQDNADLIYFALKDAKDRSVALLTHSKGSIDTLEAFLLYPEIRSKVKFWISLQAPFFGSPVADLALDQIRWRSSIKRIMNWLGGDIECVVSVSTAFRSTYMELIKDQLLEIQLEVPLFSIATSKPDEKSSWDTRFEPYFRDWLLKYEVENDGIVPWKSAVYPQSPYVHLVGLDHLWIEGKNFKGGPSPVEIMKSIFQFISDSKVSTPLNNLN